MLSEEERRNIARGECYRVVVHSLVVFTDNYLHQGPLCESMDYAQRLKKPLIVEMCWRCMTVQQQEELKLLLKGRPAYFVPFVCKAAEDRMLVRRLVLERN